VEAVRAVIGNQFNNGKGSKTTGAPYKVFLTPV